MRLPLLVLHVTAGTLGMLTGFAAMFLRKGSGRHALMGKIFVITMLIMSASGTVLAARKSEVGNVLGGAMTFCLVSTGWVTARRGEWKTGTFDWCALLATTAVAATALTYGLKATLNPSGLMYGDSAGPYFLLGSVALLAALGDIRLVLRGAITATQRRGRHLWRMCFAQFVAAASIFLARGELFPALFRETGILTILGFLPIVVMLVWMIRVRFTRILVKIKLPNWVRRPGAADFQPLEARLVGSVRTLEGLLNK